MLALCVSFVNAIKHGPRTKLNSDEENQSEMKEFKKKEQRKIQQQQQETTEHRRSFYDITAAYTILIPVLTHSIHINQMRFFCQKVPLHIKID